MAFLYRTLEIPDVLLVEPQIFRDERGYFMESYKGSDFVAHGIRDHFVQDNHSHSKRGVLRGLHYQEPPYAQSKLVHVIQGTVFDVAVDIRKGSPSYGQWVGTTLSDANQHMLYVPRGFAHGFCVLSESAEVMYKVDQEYSPQHEAGIVWNDPELAIRWPIQDPILSVRDATYPHLRNIAPVFFYHTGPQPSVIQPGGSAP